MIFEEIIIPFLNFCFLIREFYEKNIFQIDLSNYYKKIECIFFNIDWKKYSIKNLENFNISEKIMPNGLIFIWTQKLITHEIIKKFDLIKFKLVENLSIIFFERENIIKDFGNIDNFYSLNDLNLLNENYLLKSNNDFFKNSKLTLLIFRRKINNFHLELRHQRNNDILFDIYDKTKENGISDIIINKIYNIIENLLPNAVKNNKFGYIQILGKTCKRNNWSTFKDKF